MTLSIGTMMTSCRERAIAEIDPILPADFVGFWWRDITPVDSNVESWPTHAAYSNPDRGLIAAKAEGSDVPTYSPSGWVICQSGSNNAKSGFLLTNKVGEPIMSPSLTMSRSGQTKLYLRFNVWLHTLNSMRTIYATQWGEDGATNGLSVSIGAGAVYVSWLSSDGDETQTAKVISTPSSGVNNWVWIRVFIEKGEKIILEVWNNTMTSMIRTTESPFVGLLPAPSTTQHYVFWGGSKETSPGDGFFKDFGYGTDFDMPPEPRKTT